ncbi:hypothetical protein [Capnocytophaga ochracea]|jgi:hypothetical protein|uniref:Uncharacterized protein n=1 Tax=Capnocytophaga ochracea TaxID=1018 RepID=A0A2X2SPP1_CAPOC|nr:hypothetical protein [Capnocytophaga ochracea]SQA93804.1 Uncharacterised protein [Capnocytophaga ochracea]
MRKLVIKFFALDYIVRVFGSTYNWTRGANIIFPLFILAGMCLLSELYVLLCIMVCLIAIAVFFGFAYFQLFPLTENDRKYFDDVQRWQFNRYYNIQQQIDVKTNSIWCLLSNIIFIALFLVCYFIEFV